MAYQQPAAFRRRANWVIAAMPFLSGYSKRKAIKYGTVKPSSNLTNFDVFLKTNGDSDIAAELAGGGGFAITAADETTVIPFGEYLSSDGTAGDLRLRFKVSPLSTAATGDVMAYLYFDAGQTTTDDKAGTLDANHVLFMPLEEDPSGTAPQMFDWASETNKGTSSGSMTSGDVVAGIVGNAIDFDGNNDEIFVARSGLEPDPCTVELIVKITTHDTVHGEVICGKAHGAADGDWQLYVYPEGSGQSGRIRFGYRDNGSFQTGMIGSTSILGGAFHSIASSKNSSAATLYIDGAQDGTASTSGSIGWATTEDWCLGSNHGGVNDTAGTPGTYYTVGVIQEFRISSTVRSAAWIDYRYENDHNNADTVTLGMLETAGGGATLVAAAGSFVLTGQSAALAVGRLIQVDAGSFTLTGQAASLVVGRSVAAAPGTFTLTGIAADLLVARYLAADAGAFVLSGQDAVLTLSANPVLSAAAGSFALSGQMADLLVGRRLVAGAGTFVLSGQAAGLIVNGQIVLTAECGTFTLASALVNLYIGRAARTEFIIGRHITRPDGTRVLDLVPTMFRVISVPGGWEVEEDVP